MFTRIQLFTDWFVYWILNFDSMNHRWQALNFFIYDGIKIFLLLVVIIHIMTLINRYLPVEKIKNFLTRRKRYGLDHLLASFFGTITPFCSCSSIPLFVGFLSGGIPLGVTLSFLITSPLVNEVAIALFLWLFGIKITLYYIWAWIILWTFGWWFLWKMHLENEVADFVIMAQKSENMDVIKINKIKLNSWTILKHVSIESFVLIKKIMPYVLAWIAIWWVIHGFIPTWFFEQYLSSQTRYGVPLAVILWVPMYSNASGVIPVVQSLIAKWVPLGTGLTFMLAVVWLSLPEFLILKKVMKNKLLFSFFGFVALCMILIWFIFNWIIQL